MHDIDELTSTHHLPMVFCIYISFPMNSPQEIAMSSVQEELKVRVGNAEWRPLLVRQFAVTETQIDGEVPEWLKMSNMDPGVADKIAPDAEEPDHSERIEEIDKMHTEGGKHAYSTEVADDEDQGSDMGEDLVDEHTPDWIACLQGNKFFTLTQALNSTYAMHLRSWPCDMFVYIMFSFAGLPVFLHMLRVLGIIEFFLVVFM